MPILKRSSLVEVNMTIHRLTEIEITRRSSYAAASGWSERLRQLSKLPSRDQPTTEASQESWGGRAPEVRVEFLVVEEWSKAFLKRLGFDLSSSA